MSDLAMDEAAATRFWSKVGIGFGPGACWMWVAGRVGDHRQYGGFFLRRAMRRAHSVAYVNYVGEIPEGLELDHLCRNPLCVRPDHLEPVTHAENMRRWGVSQPARTHCVEGHALGEGNSFRRPDGGISCCTCRRTKARAKYHERKEST